MKIAILGASSHLAKAFIEQLHLTDRAIFDELQLFSRQPQRVQDWIQQALGSVKACLGYNSFAAGNYDAVINMVGISDARTLHRIGSEILLLTRQFDQMVISYLEAHPRCKYVFISSGAAYGDVFSSPVSDQTRAQHPIHSISTKDWYGLSKYLCEVEHRTLTHLQITDLRVFGFFSKWFDPNASFFLSQLAQSLVNRQNFQTDSTDFWRDFCGPEDLTQCLLKILEQPSLNASFDLFSLAPIRKLEVLSLLEHEFGLTYTMTSPNDVQGGSVVKSHYYSLSRDAARIGYRPSRTSGQVLVQALDALLEQAPLSFHRTAS